MVIMRQVVASWFTMELPGANYLYALARHPAADGLGKYQYSAEKPTKVTETVLGRTMLMVTAVSSKIQGERGQAALARG